MSTREFSQMTPIQKDDYLAALRSKHVVTVRRELDSLSLMELHARVKAADCYNRVALEARMVAALFDAESCNQRESE